MARGTVNKVFLVGRLGQDIELKATSSGMAFANIRLATNDGYKDAQTGQFMDATEWHRVVVFGKRAENLHQYLKKGDLLYVEGRIRTNKWTDQHGLDRYVTEVVANETQMLGSKLHESAPMPDYIPAHLDVPSSEPMINNDKPINNDYAKAKGGKSSREKNNPSLDDINKFNDNNEPPF